MSTSMADLKPVTGAWYTATFHAPSRTIRIVAKRSRFYMFVPIVSACDTTAGRDEMQQLSDFAVRRKGRSTVVTFVEKSSQWDRKEHAYEFGPDLIKYCYRVFGNGKITRAYFFRSWMNEKITLEKEMGTVIGYDQVFSPAANFFGKWYHFAGDTSIISSGDAGQYWGSGLLSAPHVFGLNRRGEKLWVWAGLGLREGQYGFDEFTYNANVTKRIHGPAGFDCSFAGKLQVDGSWQSPQMVVGTGGNEWQAIEKYVNVLEKQYGLKIPRTRKPVAWWRTPIFGGWGEQMSTGFHEQGNVEGVDNFSYCTQALHDEWLAILRKHKIRPGQVIIDAGWEKPGTTGDMWVNEERWPDLRGWIGARRKEGIRTVLWMCAWNRAGVPDEECITDACGKALNVDPSNPRYEARLRAMIRRLVSREDGCYDAYGLKIDGEMNMPLGEGLKNHGNIWGLELQRRWFEIVRTEVKKHKKDCYLGTFTASPYLAQFSDVVRTADLFSVQGDPTDEMFARARLLSITQPHCPVDTDHTYWYDVRDNWTDIAAAQLKCGVPCMYHAKYVWHKHPFMMPYIEEMTDEHFAAIRKSFDTYWNRLGKAAPMGQ